MSGSPTPLDAVLRGFCGYAMKRAFLSAQADVHRALAPLGLRMMTFSVLAVVVDRPGLKQAQAADALTVERPNMVALVDELEKAGLIARTPSPDDRRAHALVPTEAGRALCARATEAVQAHEARITAGLGAEERAGLIRMLALVERAAREETTDG